MRWLTPDEKAFFAKMDGDHNAVYVVESYYGTDRKQMGLFSTQQKAQAWCDSRPDEETCLVVPYVIDEPEFGNTPKENLA